MPTAYEILEQSILTRLQPLTAQVDVEIVPEREFDYEEPFERGRITIAYQRSEYSGQIVRGYPTNLATDAAAADEFAEVHIILRARLMRGQFGIFWMQNEVMKLLNGFIPERWGRMFPKMFEYVGGEGGIWTYDQVLVSRRISVQDQPDFPQDGPALDSVLFTFNSQP
jgi:hypothetical protein